MAPSVSGVTVQRADGTAFDLASAAGSVLLIVNVASRCGYTPQYAGLQELQERYGELESDPAEVARILEVGAERAEALAEGVLERVRTATGLLPRPGH